MPTASSRKNAYMTKAHKPRYPWLCTIYTGKGLSPFCSNLGAHRVRCHRRAIQSTATSTLLAPPTMADDGSQPFVPTEHDIDAPDAPLPTWRSDSPIAKRLRHQGSCSSLSIVEASHASSVISHEPDVPCRDTRFYLPDGSCVLRVGNALFNVRFLLFVGDSRVIPALLGPS